jgi:hypothetical protein
MVKAFFAYLAAHPVLAAYIPVWHFLCGRSSNSSADNTKNQHHRLPGIEIKPETPASRIIKLIKKHGAK